VAVSDAGATGLRAVARRELSRLAGSRLLLALSVGLPLLSFAVLWGIFARGVPSELPVVVCDQDGSSLSRHLTRLVDATRTMRVSGHVADPVAGERLMLEGRAYAMLLLPRGLERDALRGAAPVITGYYNGQWLLPGSLISRDLRTVLSTVSKGIDLRTRLRRGEMAAAARAHLEPIRVERRALFNPQMNYVYYLLATLLPAMLQIFVLLATVQAAGSELKHGTAAEWLARAGGSVPRAVAGKLLPYTAIFLVLALFMVTLLFRVLGVPLQGGLATIALATLLFVLAYQAAGLALVAFTANLRLATSLGAFYTGPAFAFTGITFPTMAMPFVARAWGAVLPLTHYLRLLVEQAVRGAPFAVSAPPIVTLAGFTAVVTAASLPRLGVILREPRFWGRG
jgi:ABC-2 type transport system permease protein